MNNDIQFELLNADSPRSGTLTFTTAQKWDVEICIKHGEVFYIYMDMEDANLELEHDDQAIAALFVQTPKGDFLSMKELADCALAMYEHIYYGEQAKYAPTATTSQSHAALGIK